MLLTPVPVNVPPLGVPPVKLNGVAVIQTALSVGAVTVGSPFTTIVWVALSVQLFPSVCVYFKVWVPIPAVIGLKLVPLTPVPLYVPGVGLPWFNVTKPLSIQTELSAEKLTVGLWLTTIV